MKTYQDLTRDELDLYNKKSKEYTGNQGDPFGNFKRVSYILSLYPKLNLADPQVVAMVYMLKQLDACCNMFSENYDGEVEGIVDRLRDISVYAKLVILLHLERQNGKSETHNS